MSGPAAALEVLLVPNTTQEGFLNSYVWAIPLSDGDAARLLALTGGSPLRRRERARFIERLVRRHSRAGRLPFLGTLADYHVDFSRVYLRLPLTD